MTRINVGVKPIELTDRHLMAEHREIKRIPNCITKGRFSMVGQPKEFKLGVGHVKFFYDKCLYLLKRYITIRDECYKRGFKVTNYADAWLDVPGKYMNDYTPTDKDRFIIQERITERLKK
jgi:hypothetical protein